ncbi:MAG: cytochrome c biogenesis protein ResB [Bacteriovorax sp.]|nr:cytochrome c biogenesis protein ResB [Rhizobacter sp.]
MIASTSGIEVRARSWALCDAVELIPSMRFAISLLTAICIASGIDTVVKQHASHSNEVNQFGPFWAECSAEASLYAVSSAWWFLLILTFLVMSTRLCTACNAPKIIAGLRTYKEQVREQALAAFHDEGQAELPETPVQAFEPISAQLQAAGWKTKLELRKDGE